MFESVQMIFSKQKTKKFCIHWNENNNFIINNNLPPESLVLSQTRGVIRRIDGLLPKKHAVFDIPIMPSNIRKRP